MTPQQIISKVAVLQSAAKKMLNDIIFDYRVVPPKEPFCEWCDQGWPKFMPDKESGIYLLSSQEDKVIYIGKATKSNMGAEVWGKFNKYRLDSNGKKEFYQNRFVLVKSSPEIRDAIQQGKVFLTFLIIDPAEMASLLEVYLQTTCYVQNDWPELNQRIG
ncbi:MAG: hypothetical protein BWK80_23590 [Desulfobacteraceae bacterium IS3]|nr:MAG: hypothetical protein BWK80_23590 [Desulfobacteraceae bacterium IS3]